MDPAHVLACGDGENDVEMLQLVGTSCAMGNAGAKVCLMHCRAYPPLCDPKRSSNPACLGMVAVLALLCAGL